MIRVSIITVSFNSENTIRTTIESVLRQTRAPYEYIIIDGLSEDRTIEIAHEYNDKFIEKGIIYTVISEKDKGIYDGMNKGIRRASGDIIGMINSDDWYEKNAVETVVKTYVQSPFSMFYADIRIIKQGGGQFIKRSKEDRFPTSRHWNHPTTFITKKTYDELGLYQCKGIHDDFDFFLRIRKAEKKIIIKNVVLANFRMGGSSNDRTISKCIKRCRDRYDCYRNNGFSRFYILECIAVETVKYFMR